MVSAVETSIVGTNFSEIHLQIIFILQIESYFEMDLFFCNVNKVYILLLSKLITR